MLGFPMLDVLIGLSLIYFILSVTCSAAAEMVSSWRRLRARNFENIIHRLLTGEAATDAPDPQVVRLFREHPIVQAAASAFVSAPGPTAAIVKQDNPATNKWPSYLSARSFSTVLLDMLAPQTLSSGNRRTFWALRDAVLMGDQPDGAKVAMPANIGASVSAIVGNSNLQNTLQAFIETATARIPGGGIDADVARLASLRTQIESWYDETMERGSGDYKRQVQSIVLVTSAVLVLFLNVDTISIAQRLATNSDSRQALIQQAVAVRAGPTNTQVAVDGPIQPPAAPTTNQIEQEWNDLGHANLPLGWDSFVFPDSGWSAGVGCVVTKVFGLLLTVFAVSLGTPFWFDVLGKLVNLRSTGEPPKASSDNQPAPTSGSADAESSGAAAGSPGTGRAAGTSAAAATGAVAPSAPAAAPQSAATILPANYWSLPARASDLTNIVTTGAFDKVTAALMARASLLAYQPPANLKQIATTAWNLASENVQVFGAGNEQAFGFATPDFVVIAFRGTVPKILDTVLADARICLKPPSFGPLPQADPRRPLQVHCGFLAAMDGLLAATPSNPIDFLALEANKNKKIFVTGHSLGAAMATLFAAKLLAEGSTRFCGLCTFGSPRVGTTAFTQWLDGLLSGRSFRFVDDQDVVTRVAPRELGYDHVDAVYFLNANGQMETTGAGWTQFLNTVIDAVTDFKNLAALSVDDHSMDLYVRKIENLASA